MTDMTDLAVDASPGWVHDLPPLVIRGKTTLPIVQGGMGVGVSAHRLAGTVAGLGAVGTIASIDLRRHHPDLMAQSANTDKATVTVANLTALDREIRAAKELAGGRGLVAVNIMRAVTDYAVSVRQACASGADAIVMGAGLPLDLPDLAADFPDVALIPLLSDARGIQLVIKKWARKGRLPDAIVIEHPRHAGGHLGAAKIDDLADPRFDFDRVLGDVHAYFRAEGIAAHAIPLIPAGGINTHERIRELLALGAAAVQLGTAFAVTEEGDAHIAFKRVLAGARPDDIVEFMSVAGLPARAVRTPWLETYLAYLPKLAAVARKKARCSLKWDCLIQCGLRDGNAKIGQFCIDTQLAAALKGDVAKGLFFRGAAALPFGSEIRPVRDLLGYLLTGRFPAASSAAGSTAKMVNAPAISAA
jgi:nitronate monooxygenase